MGRAIAARPLVPLTAAGPEVYSDSSFGIPSITETTGRSLHPPELDVRRTSTRRSSRAPLHAAARATSWHATRRRPGAARADGTFALSAARQRCAQNATRGFAEWYDENARRSTAFPRLHVTFRARSKSDERVGYDYFDARYKGAPIR